MEARQELGKLEGKNSRHVYGKIKIIKGRKQRDREFIELDVTPPIVRYPLLIRPIVSDIFH